MARATTTPRRAKQLRPKNISGEKPSADGAGERAGGALLQPLCHAASKYCGLLHPRLPQPRHVIGGGPGAGSSEVGLDVLPRTISTCLQCHSKQYFTSFP